MFRLHWDVAFAIFCWLSVAVGIHSEDVEVAFVARPCPVVGVGTELADAPRRAAHQAHVLVFVIFKEDKLVAAVERHILDTHAAVAPTLLGEGAAVLGDEYFALGLAGLGSDAFQHGLGHVFHLI